MVDSSSSDSELGERFRNLSKCLIKSTLEQQEEVENNVYKRKLGDLIFDANFESGNLGHVEQIDHYEYDLMVRPDVLNSRFRLWFNFTVSNQRPNQCVIFTFVNLSERIGLFHEGFGPLVRSKLNPNWVRLHEDQVFYYRSRYHDNRFVLSVAFKFSSYDDEHQFALSYPCEYSKLTRFIDRWVVELKRAKRAVDLSTGSFSAQLGLGQQLLGRRSPEDVVGMMASRRGRKGGKGKDYERRAKSSLGFSSPTARRASTRKRPPSKAAILNQEQASLRVESLCSSFLSKKIHHLSVAGKQSSGVEPLVIVFCRSYGNLDGAAQIICQGMLDFLLSDDPLARAARQVMQVDFYPMLNPDASFAGNSRSDLMGQTRLTKDFLVSVNFRFYENLLRFFAELEKVCARKERRVVIIELRVNYELLGSRILGKQEKWNSFRMERHLAFPRLLARFASDFYLEHCQFSHKSAWPSSYFDFNFNFESSSPKGVDQYALEVSPFAHYKRSLLHRSYQVYSEQKYLRLSKAIVYALLEYLRPKEAEEEGDGNGIGSEVVQILEGFQPTSGDIDDLTLKRAPSERYRGVL